MFKKISFFKNMTVELRGLFENVTVRIRTFENMTCGGERPRAYIYVYIGPNAQIEDIK